MDEYPTDEELETIKNWPVEDHMGLIEYLRDFWYYPDYVRISGKKVIRFELHTGGWSGNEEVIGVLENHLFWMMFWEKSVHGGHYYFKLPRWATKERINRA